VVTSPYGCVLEETNASFPYKSHDLWFLTEDIRWGYLPANTDTKALIDKVNRSDLWREAAKAIGQEKAIPASDSRGKETFFDGVVFDPRGSQGLPRQPQDQGSEVSFRPMILQPFDPPGREPFRAAEPRPSKDADLAPILKQSMPYLICIGAFLMPGSCCPLILGESRLPGPINVVAHTWDPYISQPFFDDGGTSKGLGWQILISLQRVAMGYSLAAMVGITIGGLLGLNRFLGKGFDPVIQVLRTVPPLAWFPISLMVFQDANTRPSS
jgi:hypothetical protein